jgi:integration host factor subunit alpha
MRLFQNNKLKPLWLPLLRLWWKKLVPASVFDVTNPTNTTRAQPMDITVESLETPALTKAQLAELLFEQIGLNKRESKDMIDAFFELIANSLVDGNDVKVSGFGNFQIRTKAPRPGRNPRTGEAIPIAARRVVTFHASQKLKEQIQDQSPLKPGNV